MSGSGGEAKRVAVDVCVLTVREGALAALLVRLPGSRWALPGAGPIDAATDPARAAVGALASTTGASGVELEQLYTFDRPEEGAVRIAHLGLTSPERHRLSPGPEAVDVAWTDLDDLPPLGTGDREVLEHARERVRSKATYAPVAFRMLPESFSLGEVQSVYEAILGTSLDTRNFRRDLRASGVVERVGTARAEGPGRPAALYRHVPGEFAVLARERRKARAIAASEREAAR
jgi:8-oxo-dGTP diphosphatase